MTDPYLPPKISMTKYRLPPYQPSNLPNLPQMQLWQLRPHMTPLMVKLVIACFHGFGITAICHSLHVANAFGNVNIVLRIDKVFTIVRQRPISHNI